MISAVKRGNKNNYSLGQAITCCVIHGASKAYLSSGTVPLDLFEMEYVKLSLLCACCFHSLWLSSTNPSADLVTKPSTPPFVTFLALVPLFCITQKIIMSMVPDPDLP
jgi:hypothetical protein